MSVRAAWIFLGVLHVLPLAAGLHWGWLAGFCVMAAVHLLLVGLTLWPCGPFCGRVERAGTLRPGERHVHLTIDDGPGADTAEVLRLLAESDAQAVFFLIGERAAARPEDVRAIVAAGHVIGNHTQHHFATRQWSFGPARLRREIGECQETLRSITGVAPQWFRPPAGFANPFTAGVLEECGLRCMGWSVRGYDGTDTDVDRILLRLTRGIRPGATILVHQGMAHHVEVLARLLAWLRENGYRVRA